MNATAAIVAVMMLVLASPANAFVINPDELPTLRPAPREDVWGILPPSQYDFPFPGKIYMDVEVDIKWLRPICGYPFDSRANVTGCAYRPGTHGLKTTNAASSSAKQKTSKGSIPSNG